MPDTPPTAQLTEGPVGPVLTRMVWPMVGGLVAVMLFSVVDTLYVGQLGARELAAMGFTFPVVFLLQSLAMGLSIGTSSVISRAIGQGDHEAVQQLTTNSLLLSLLLISTFALLGLLTLDPVFTLLGASAETLPLVRNYMVVWFLAFGFLVVPMVGNSAIRATGDTRTPALIMIIAGLINIVLDPFLIFGLGPFPRMELRGAALASGLSWVLTSAASLWFLGQRLDLLHRHWPRRSTLLNAWRRVLYVAGPAAATNMLVPFSAAILTRMLAAHGETAVAAFGVGTRLESVALIPCFALSSVLGRFVGQNHGADDYARVRASLRFSVRYALLAGLVVFVVLGVLALPLARLFNHDPDIIRYTTAFLWVVPISYGAYGMMLLVNAAFNALNQPLQSGLVIILRLFVFTVPLAWLGSVLAGVWGIFAGITAGNLLIGGAAYLLMRHHLVTAE